MGPFLALSIAYKRDRCLNRADRFTYAKLADLSRVLLDILDYSLRVHIDLVWCLVNLIELKDRTRTLMQYLSST